MTEIVRLQRKKKLPPEFIKLTAEIRAAGFDHGVNMDSEGIVTPTRAAAAKGPSHKRVIKRYGTYNKWLKALEKRYGAWARTWRP